MTSDKVFWQSKKFLMGAIAIGAVVTLALTGSGDPAAYGAIGVIAGVACGGQAAADYAKAQKEY